MHVRLESSLVLKSFVCLVLIMKAGDDVSAQACRSWPIRADFFPRRGALKRQAQKNGAFRQKMNTGTAAINVSDVRFCKPVVLEQGRRTQTGETGCWGWGLIGPRQNTPGAGKQDNRGWATWTCLDNDWAKDWTKIHTKLTRGWGAGGVRRRKHRWGQRNTGRRESRQVTGPGWLIRFRTGVEDKSGWWGAQNNRRVNRKLKKWQ